MYNYSENQDSPYDPIKLPICSFLRADSDLESNFGHKFKKTVSSDDIFFIDEIILNNVDFYCSITLDTEAPTFLDRSTDNGKTLPDPLKYLSASQITINIYVLLMKGMHPIYFWTRTS